MRNQKLVVVAGGTGSGKTTLCSKVKEVLGDKLCLISLDNYFYRDADSNNRPDSIDIERLLRHLDLLTSGKAVSWRSRNYEPSPITLVEGHLALTFPRLVEDLDLSIFVDLDAEERTLRRLERNMAEGREFEEITDWYRGDVKENHWRYIEPTKKKADLIMWGEINSRRVQVLANILNGLING